MLSHQRDFHMKLSFVLLCLSMTFSIPDRGHSVWTLVKLCYTVSSHIFYSRSSPETAREIDSSMRWSPQLKFYKIHCWRLFRYNQRCPDISKCSYLRLCSTGRAAKENGKISTCSRYQKNKSRRTKASNYQKHRWYHSTLSTQSPVAIVIFYLSSLCYCISNLLLFFQLTPLLSSV